MASVPSTLATLMTAIAQGATPLSVWAVLELDSEPVAGAGTTSPLGAFCWPLAGSGSCWGDDGLGSEVVTSGATIWGTPVLSMHVRPLRLESGTGLEV